MIDTLEEDDTKFGGFWVPQNRFPVYFIKCTKTQYCFQKCICIGSGTFIHCIIPDIRLFDWSTDMLSCVIQERFQMTQTFLPQNLDSDAKRIWKVPGSLCSYWSHTNISIYWTVGVHKLSALKTFPIIHWCTLFDNSGSIFCCFIGYTWLIERF